MKRVLLSLPLIAGFALVPAGFALGASNPAGQGKPNQDCVSIVQHGGTEPGNGHAAASPGSVFNEAALTGGTGGTGGNAYNNAGAPSQYDVACYQATTRP